LKTSGTTWRVVLILGLIAPAGPWLDAHPMADIFSKLPHEWSLFHDPEFGERMPAGGADLDDPKFLEAFIICNTRQPTMAANCCSRPVDD